MFSPNTAKSKTFMQLFRFMGMTPCLPSRPLKFDKRPQKSKTFTLLYIVNIELRDKKNTGGIPVH